MANRFFPNYDTYKITSPFGERVIFGSTSFHHGIDLVAKANDGSSRTDDIMAHTGGTVALVGYNDSIGNYIYIQTAPNVQMAYFHFRDKLAFKVGDKITKGQILGYMGATGQVTGAHLHWAIKVNGNWVDPEPYLDKDYVVEVPPTYVGYLDTATTSAITGWAWNSIDDAALKVDIQISKDNKIVKAISTTANIYRADLLNAKKGNGKHGFSVNFDFNTLDSGTYKVDAYTYGKKLNNTKTVVIEKKVAATPKPNTSTTTQSTVKITAGQVLNLENVPLYGNSSTTKEAGKVTGTYYIWSNSVENGRVRITNAANRVGVDGQVTGFVNVADIGAKATVNTTVSNTTTTAESYDERITRLAKEVWAGKHGTGADRKKSLGADYDAVQKKIEELYY